MTGNVKQSQRPIRVLMVCMGNICRSPTAQAVMEHLVQQAGLQQHIEVDSAGTHNYHTGKQPDARSQQHAQARGYDLSQQRARQLHSADFAAFDWVLVMDADNKSTYRAVDLGPKIEGLRIVRSGLNKGDTIIVKGLQKVRPGSPVTPEVIPMANEQTLAALAQQRQALEASNLPQIKPATGAPKLASVATPRG